MKKAAYVLALAALTVNLFGCDGKGNNQAGKGVTKGEKADAPVAKKNETLALSFLEAIRNGDKNAMYQAANLTPDIVNEHREKLVHPDKHKQSELQKKESENVLRISGQIDFLHSKFRQVVPKTSSVRITGSEVTTSGALPVTSVHTARITYNDQKEGLKDKTGKTAKELELKLLQIQHTVGDRSINEFSFDSKDFEKFADRDFKVISYY